MQGKKLRDDAQTKITVHVVISVVSPSDRVWIEAVSNCFLKQFYRSTLHSHNVGTISILPYFCQVAEFFHSRFRPLRPLNQLQEVAQHAHCGDSRTSAGALYDEWARAVPLSMEHDDVIRATQGGGEWMIYGISAVLNQRDVQKLRTRKNKKKKKGRVTYFSNPALT